eukprot:scaffold1262_cov106-Cylindrotheca_fusiformis.AAC.5
MTSSIEWKSITLEGSSGASIGVSNHLFHLPDGIAVLENILDDEEASNLLNGVDNQSFRWEGFEQRRKVLKYKNLEELPREIDALVRRFIDKTGRKPATVMIEEYPRNQLTQHLGMTQTTVTTFESPPRCKCRGDCSCFVAVLPVYTSVIESINKPKERRPDCWDLCSANHNTGILLQNKSFYIKSSEFLWEWRSRISASGPGANGNHPIVLVKLCSIPEATSPVDNLEENSIFGYTANANEQRAIEVPPLEDVLTVIVTTSPIKSNPSTELLERVFESFLYGGIDFAYKCRKVIVCDGCRQRDENVTKKHNSAKQAMRNGIVDQSQLENYIQFKKRLRSLCEKAPDDSPFANSVVQELDSRHGYGFALRHALQEYVSTPYVIVIQHDRTFMRPTPIAETIAAMWHNQKVKYVGMSMRSNLLYRDVFVSKYGKSYMEDMKSCILKPNELLLDAKQYGPNGATIEDMDFGGQAKLRKNIIALAETYKGSQSNADHQAWLKQNPVPLGKTQLSLTPTFFWYDNVHICETAHYRDFVFHPRFKMVVRGGFVEDTLSPVIRKAVERLGLVKGHERFGCYLLDDHSGMFFTGHLDGGTYLTKLARREFVEHRSTKEMMGTFPVLR